jgi:predicted lipoprotein with Yx(FWY)xxD motif
LRTINIYEIGMALMLVFLFMAMSPVSGQVAQNYSVNVDNDPIIGSHLVDSNDYSLYVSTNDRSGNSTCTGQCAANWPPFYAGSSITVPSGLSKSNFGTITRADGTKQTTYMGRPLYRFFGEQNPGDAGGDGVGGVWYVARPSGSIQAPGNSTTGTTGAAGTSPANISNNSIASRAARSIYNSVANATASVTNRTGY